MFSSINVHVTIKVLQAYTVTMCVFVLVEVMVEVTVTSNIEVLVVESYIRLPLESVQNDVVVAVAVGSRVAKKDVDDVKDVADLVADLVVVVGGRRGLCDQLGEEEEDVPCDTGGGTNVAPLVDKGTEMGIISLVEVITVVTDLVREVHPLSHSSQIVLLLNAVPVGARVCDSLLLLLAEIVVYSVVTGVV